MSPRAYTEDQLVEQPAIGFFAEMGWATVSAGEEFFGRSGDWGTEGNAGGSQSLLTSTPTSGLGRETKGEVVLVSRLRAALVRLNPALPP